MNYTVHGVAKSWTRLSNFQFISGDLSCSFGWAHVFFFHCIPRFTLYWDLSIKKQTNKQKKTATSPGAYGLVSYEERIVALKKRCVTWELWVKFYLGQYEDSSLQESTSDSSEKQLQRGRGKGQHICDFGEVGVHAIKHIFFVESFCWSREASASHEKWSF